MAGGVDVAFGIASSPRDAGSPQIVGRYRVQGAQYVALEDLLRLGEFRHLYSRQVCQERVTKQRLTLIIKERGPT